MEDAYDQAIQYMQRSEQLQKGVIEQQQRDAQNLHKETIEGVDPEAVRSTVFDMDLKQRMMEDQYILAFR